MAKTHNVHYTPDGTLHTGNATVCKACGPKEMLKHLDAHITKDTLPCNSIMPDGSVTCDLPQGHKSKHWTWKGLRSAPTIYTW